MATKRKVRVDQEYDLVPVGKLQEHPQNPRQGDVEAISESIDVNGWYGAVTAQKSTGYILAGNHRFRVAKSKGAKTVPTVWVDVDDQTAIRILLADNKTADLGGYDEALLTELLKGLETLDGTGWGDQVLAAEEGDEKGADGLGEVPEDVYTPSWGVIVVCDDEAHQERVYEELEAAGHRIRVVAV